MHGFNLSLLTGLEVKAALKSLSAPGRGKSQPASLLGAGTIHGMRNLFRRPNPNDEETFSAGGLVEEARQGRPKPLRKLMRKLASRMEPAIWHDPLQPGLAPSDNPRIPAGYTYLLQLIAHDMVHSSLSMSATTVGGAMLANTRLVPLTLETIYGGGSAVSPQAYEIDNAHRGTVGLVPRTQFRVGRSRPKPVMPDGCPFRDIARAVPADVNDAGLDANERLNLLACEGGNPPEVSRQAWRTEALIADPRNDDHALLSQLTLLFQLLHNHVIDMIPASGAMASLPPAEQAFRRFVCARLAVTHIYRNVLRKDVLNLILHPAVYAAYNVAKPTILDHGFPGSREGIPLEFAHGAFRFGHAMVKDSYRVNNEMAAFTIHALEQSSLRSPRSLPVTHDWLVDWSRFFDTGLRPPNLSRRIGPSYSGPLRNTWAFPPLMPETDREGLADRDMVSAAYAGMWSVRALSKELRSKQFGELVPDYRAWEELLRTWLVPKPDQIDPLSPDEINLLAADPPLPFFVLFEAAQSREGRIRHATGGGQHLGPIGSIIAAETIFGALERHPIVHEDKPTLKQRIAVGCTELLGNPSVLDAVPEISNMRDLLKFLSDGGVIRHSPPT